VAKMGDVALLRRWHTPCGLPKAAPRAHCAGPAPPASRRLHMGGEQAHRGLDIPHRCPCEPCGCALTVGHVQAVAHDEGGDGGAAIVERRARAACHQRKLRNARLRQSATPSHPLPHLLPVPVWPHILVGALERVHQRVCGRCGEGGRPRQLAHHMVHAEAAHATTRREAAVGGGGSNACVAKQRVQCVWTDFQESGGSKGMGGVARHVAAGQGEGEPNVVQLTAGGWRQATARPPCATPSPHPTRSAPSHSAAMEPPWPSNTA
jgi:hypothetical protein